MCKVTTKSGLRKNATLSVCGMCVFMCFCSFLMQNVYLLASYRFQLCFKLCLCIPVSVCLHVCVCSLPTWMCSGSVTWPSTGHSVGRRHSLWILLLVVLFWRQKAVRATQTTSRPPPPPSSAERLAPWSPCSPFPGPQSLGCGLWMSVTSWLSAKGLAGDWPVVEVQYQALSVSSSFYFLPPISAGYSQWHKHTPCRAVTDSDLWLENERIALRIGIFITMPMKRGCLKPLSARVLCF